jgi:hypothetical protein
LPSRSDEIVGRGSERDVSLRDHVAAVCVLNVSRRQHDAARNATEFVSARVLRFWSVSAVRWVFYRVSFPPFFAVFSDIYAHFSFDRLGADH